MGEKPLLRRRVRSESSESFEIQFVATEDSENSNDELAAETESEAMVQVPLLPEHLVRRLQQAVERERPPLEQRLKEAELRRRQLIEKRVAAAALKTATVDVGGDGGRTGGRAFEICFAEETARVTSRYLPARLQRRLQSVKNRWPRPNFQERMAAVERRRKRLFEKRALTVRQCERRCLRLAQAVEAVHATQEGQAPMCSSDMRELYHDMTHDMAFLLGRFEKKQYQQPPAPSLSGCQDETSRGCSGAGAALTFDVTFGGQSGAAVGQLPRRLRRRLQQLESRKRPPLDFEARHEAARCRRQRFCEKRAAAARESENRCSRLAQAMRVINGRQAQLRDEQQRNERSVRALYTAVQADLALVLGRMEEDAAWLTQRNFRHVPREYTVRPPAEPHVKACLCERCSFFGASAATV